MKGKKIKKYYIEAILWEDHTLIERAPLPEDPDAVVLPTLSVGIVMQETEKTLTLVTSIERFTIQEDNASYLLIYKSSVIGRKRYGKIEIANLS